MGLRGGLVLAGLLGLLPVNNGVAWSAAVSVLALLAVWLLLSTRTRRSS
jgi:hypothetical protein